MLYKTYELFCRPPAPIASERIGALLAKEGVKYEVADLSIASTRTPIAITGVEPKMYSHSNWVGINPFAFVSGVEVQCEQVESDRTRVTIHVNRLRALLWVAFWITCSSLTAVVMPQPGGVILAVVVACVAWFGLVSFLGGYLVREEITNCLEDRP